jgi:L-cysteine/cystine lyase
VLTSEEEHQGLLGPLQAIRDRRGVVIRAAPLRTIFEAVSSRTKLVACSQVGWVTGSAVPAGPEVAGVPVLLDGAQGLGTVPTDVAALGCSFYVGPAQKWLCGPDGVGMLWVSQAWRDRVAVGSPAIGAFVDPEAGLDARLHADARRLDASVHSAEALAFAIASIEVLEAAGWPWVRERSRIFAAALANSLTAAGRCVAPRGATAIVSFTSDDAAQERMSLLELGVYVRNIPGTNLLRASVGAWNDRSDLERLLSALARPRPRASS